MVQKIRVTAADEQEDIRGIEVHAELRRLGIDTVTRVRTAKVYRFETEDKAAVRELAEKVLTDFGEVWTSGAPPIEGASRVEEVAYRPGVMNPESASLMKAAADLGLTKIKAATSSVEYYFFGELPDVDLKLLFNRFLLNETVQEVVRSEPTSLIIEGKTGAIKVIPLRDMNDDELMALSDREELRLSLERMKFAQEHHRSIGRDPFDGEIKTYAQTWSEHCYHGIFKSPIRANGVLKKPFMTRLKETAAKYSAGVVSAFVDNSGVIEFYDGFAICGKVETHNSPSAIEPYGGAATGSGGVFRDIMGTGQGAKVLLSTDMFCFAPPELPEGCVLPPGCLHPDYLLRRVVAGVRDYGNRMGVPTSNGSVHFDPDFRAKPAVIVGAYGIMPKQYAHKRELRVGDKVIVVGGRTGRDGINGATFSSGAMTDKTITRNAGAVQIGHAIEEKRVADALLACRDAEYIIDETDCGAGGLSSACGELGRRTGIRIWLEKVRLKYPGLAPFEIWISESQERMVIIVRAGHEEEVIQLFADFNVEATVIGEITDTQKLVVTWNGETLCDIPMSFLFNDLPLPVLEAEWNPTATQPITVTEDPLAMNWQQDCLAVMGHLNVCSKEPIVRMYDHGVQGTCALPPFTGVHLDGPNDAVVLTPLLGKPYGMVVSHGMNPSLTRLDPYWASISASVEALANSTAVGGNPKDVGLIDNFIWPVPDKHYLGALDLAVDGCVAVMDAFHLPFVSGKDSLGSTYRSGTTKIDIPPIVCASSFGKIPDVMRTQTADFKRTDTLLILFGDLNYNLGGSVYAEVKGYTGGAISKPDLDETPQTLKRVYELIAQGKILAAKDIHKGGLFAAVAKMCFGGDCGAYLNLGNFADHSTHHPAFLLFSQTPGCILAEMRLEDFKTGACDGVIHNYIGTTRPDKHVVAAWRGQTLFEIATDELKQAWQAPMRKVFNEA